MRAGRVSVGAFAIASALLLAGGAGGARRAEAGPEQLQLRIRILEQQIAKYDEAIATYTADKKIDDVRKSVLEESGAPAYAKELRAKFDALREPVDMIDTEIKNLQTTYDDIMKRGGGFDLWGMIDPKGAYGDQLREIARNIRAKRKEREAKTKEIDAKVAADDDLKTYKTLDGLGKAVDRVYRDFYDKELPENVELKRMIVDRGNLVRERDHLVGVLASLEDTYVVWTNDVGWVHVGSMAMFERAKNTPHHSEKWGGMGNEPLVNTLALGGTKFHEYGKAIEALGAALGSSLELKHAPTASPPSYWVGKLGGKEVMIGRDVMGAEEFKKFMPK